jgi:hypothetical protein
VDFPVPGRPRANIDGLAIRPARNHDTGSAHTVAPVSKFGPSGAPADGEPAPAANGHSPQTWTLVPRHIAVACILVMT